MKKIVKLTLVFSLMLLSLNEASNVYATDFEGKEEYYATKCKVSPLPKADMDICEEFNEYLKEKSESLQQEIENTKETLADIETDIAKVQALIEEYEEKIATKNIEIGYLEERIVVLEEEIEKKDTLIRDRMYQNQGINNTNIYIDVLFGASSLEEFFSVYSAISEITAYDYELLQSLEKDKQDLGDAKERLVVEKGNLEDLQALQLEAETILLKEKAFYDEAFEKQYEMSEEYQSDIDAIKDAIKEGVKALNTPPSSSGSWGQPLASGIVTAVGWNYPTIGGGKVHTGMDIGANVGTELYAPANGVVIYSYSGCPTWGSGYGDSCAGGKGNNLVMIVQVDGLTYVVKYYHMQKLNYLNYKSGDFISVNKGDVLGYVGNSGSSTGPHVHIEVFNMGYMSYMEVANKYATYGGQFGMSSGSGALGYRCSVLGSTPCRETSSDIFGYTLRQTLN